MTMRTFLLLALLLALLMEPFAASAKSIEVFVALCDNESQGIAPVPKKIGNGDDPANNLYWGCSDGMKSYFKNSRKWTLVKAEKPAEGHILERLTFTHKASKTTLVAHAYRGRNMKECLEDFLTATRDAGKGDLVAFIGHNGLMDTQIKMPRPAAEDDEASSSIVLCCISEGYFIRALSSSNSRPLVLTSQLMYPGSFILHDSIEIWLKNGSRTAHREAASKAYAKNQKISTKAARTIFAKLED